MRSLLALGKGDISYFHGPAVLAVWILGSSPRMTEGGEPADQDNAPGVSPLAIAPSVSVMLGLDPSIHSDAERRRNFSKAMARFRA
ncbi:hypothetical protein BMW22_16175 [Rhizobium leguminosarum]|uniref:Uncharacterized protein n=1 Tax=Rhizobium leguminosarum TaxID=384 RepID=A0A1L3ZBF0_RHILE|nr:hypothetical protein BMW22_16175 [Rhizobium leguminosarum]